MNISYSFIRLLMVSLCMLFMSAYMLASAEDFHLANLIIGLILGGGFGALLVGLESIFLRFNMRTFNVALFGLFCGYLMGEAISFTFSAAMDAVVLPMSGATYALLRVAIYLASCYFGMILAARCSEELYVSVPFVRFKASKQKKKDVLIDYSALTDSRILELAGSGLLDHQLYVPRFVVKEATLQSESTDEVTRSRGRRGLDLLKKMENLPYLELNYIETDFTDIPDLSAKICRLARVHDANLLTADLSRLQQTQLEGIRVININLLANALKPLTQSGEFIYIKIQRYGKEPRQGVGYLEDGTMVVVNGGAEFIGETIKSQVLSVKHTTSGRMIFCNSCEEGQEGVLQAMNDLEPSPKNYFTL